MGRTADVCSDRVASFDGRAAALVALLSDVGPGDSKAGGSFGIDLRIPKHIVVKGAMHEEIPVFDGRGFKSMADERGRLTLSGDAYIEFRNLCERIQSTRSLRDTVSVSFIRKHLFEWLVGVRRGDVASQRYCAALIERLSGAVATLDVCVPLKNVFVEIDFPIVMTKREEWADDQLSSGAQ